MEWGWAVRKKCSLTFLISPRRLFKVKVAYIAKESWNYTFLPFISVFHIKFYCLTKSQASCRQNILTQKPIHSNESKTTCLFREYIMGSIAVYEDCYTVNFLNLCYSKNEKKIVRIHFSTLHDKWS